VLLLRGRLLPDNFFFGNVTYIHNEKDYLPLLPCSSFYFCFFFFFFFFGSRLLAAPVASTLELTDTQRQKNKQNMQKLNSAYELDGCEGNVASKDSVLSAMMMMREQQQQQQQQCDT
jgi:hypothetical protein